MKKRILLLAMLLTVAACGRVEDSPQSAPIPLRNIPVEALGDDAGGNIKIAGDKLFAFGMAPALRVYDIKNRNQIKLIGTLDDIALRVYAEPDQPLNKAVVQGAFAYVASGKNLGVIDLKNPAEPKIAAIVESAASSSAGLVINYYHNHIYLSHLDGTAIIDVSNPYQPRKVKELAEMSNVVWDAVTSNNLLLINGLDSPKGLSVYDLTHPSDPVLLDYAERKDIEDATHMSVMAVDGEKLYSVNVHNKLSIIDLADAKNPRILFEGELPIDLVDATSYNTTLDVKVHGGRLYIGKGEMLHILDVMNPARPVILSRTDADSDLIELEVADDAVFASATSARLIVFENIP